MDEGRAKQGYALMAAARFAGVLLVVAGLGAALGDYDLSPWLGYALVLSGMALFFWMPKFLARRWRTPKP